MTTNREYLLPKQWPSYDDLRTLERENPAFDQLSTYTLLESLRVFSELQCELEKNFAEIGFSLGQYTALSAIATSEADTVTPASLADHLGISRSTTTNLLDELESEDLIQRVRRRDDRRKVNVALTKEARRRLKAFLPDHWRRISKTLGVLSQEEQKELIRLLQKLSRALGTLSNPPDL